MTDKDIQHVSFQGIHHSKNPSLAVDGTALESFNLRPGKNGLELVHDKEMTRIVRVPNDAGMTGKKITFVFRHHALPENSYLFVFDNRTVMLSLDGVMQKEEDGSYFKIEYGEDIIDMGELNNVLVIRTDSKQDFWLWRNNQYTKMPPVRMPREMILEQEFDKEAPDSPSKNPFFGAVIGFKPGERGSFEKGYKENLEQALQYVQGIRAEEEAEQRKIGKFVGHVLVRCAFKTAQGNYISYGPVLHAEIGAYYQATKTSRFPTKITDESGMEWHEKLLYKVIISSDGTSSNIIPPDGAAWDGVTHALWPINCLWDTLANADRPNPVMELTHKGTLPNAGFSQPPVFVGAIPYSVWSNYNFKGGVADTPGFSRRNGRDSTSQTAIGVYVPGIVYSYPVLKIRFGQETLDAIRFYKENNIVQSLSVAMTAPVKHGFGTNLVKVNTITYDQVAELKPFYYKDDKSVGSPLYDPSYPLVSDGNSTDRKNYDYLDVYGYARNIDTNPDNLMNNPFYIVKDISLEELLGDSGISAGGVYEIPLQLKGIGVEEDEDGDVTTSEDDISNSQEGQVDPDSVSLDNIENAKPLPTDDFSCHTFIGGSYLEYNRRLHMFGVENILFEGYTPSPSIQRDQFGFGRNGITGIDKKNVYWESLIVSDKKEIIVRYPLETYMYEGDNRYKMLLPDILTYPDYRCKMMRLVKNEGGKWYNLSGDLECNNSVLNNLAYVAFTKKDIDEVDGLYLSCSHGLTLLGRIRYAGALDKEQVERGKTMVYDAGIYKENTMYGIALGKYGYAYAPDDTLAYYNKVLDIGKDLSEYPEADYTGYEIGGVIEDSNRVQVSETDDVFSYPAKNSYRFGSLDNRIIAANSVYGQVTEQKFGMFPLYVFTEEGIFTMEQGTGDIMYSNISKINDDCLTSKFSICNTGDSIAYVVRDGLRLIQGRQAMRIGEHGDGKPYIILPPSKGVFKDAVSSFADLVSLDRFNNDIQDSVLFYDSYNHEILILCKNHPLRKRLVTFAFNTDTNQLFKRFDSLNESSLSGIVHGNENLVWHSEIKAGNVNTVRMYDFDTSDQEYGESGFLDKSEFLYVSNPIKLSEGAYKRIEHSVMRFYGSGIESLELLYFGSLDCIKWFQMGGGRVSSIKEMTDFTMRRMPCSVRYVIVVIKGKAEHIQIQGLDAEIRMRYAGRLR